MNKDLLHTGLLAISFLALFGVAELLYYQLHVAAELTRKLVHMGTGFLTLLFPLLNDPWLVLLLCGTFAIIILASLRFNFLRSINGIERRSHGSISYPVSVFGCYLVYHYYSAYNHVPHPAAYLYFYLPILTLAICDPIAALTGKRFPFGKFTIGKDTKTLVGSSAFFIASFLLTLSLCSLLSQGVFSFGIALPLALLVAVLSALAEAVSGKGMDNITIPLAVVLILIVYSPALQ